MAQIELSTDEHSALTSLAGSADRTMEPGVLLPAKNVPAEVRDPIFEAFDTIARAQGLEPRACRFQSYPELGRSFLLTGDQQVPDLTYRAKER